MRKLMIVVLFIFSVLLLSQKANAGCPGLFRVSSNKISHVLLLTSLENSLFDGFDFVNCSDKSGPPLRGLVAMAAQFVASITTNYTIELDTCGNSFNPAIKIIEGSDCNANNETFCIPEPCSSYKHHGIVLTAGLTYTVLIADINKPQGPIVPLSWTNLIIRPTEFWKYPDNQTYDDGFYPVTLEVFAATLVPLGLFTTTCFLLGSGMICAGYCDFRRRPISLGERRDELVRESKWSTLPCCPRPPVARIRFISFLVVFCAGSIVLTAWSVVWASAAYFLSVITVGITIAILLSLKEPSAAATSSFVMHWNWLRPLLWIMGVLAVLNSIVAIIQSINYINVECTKKDLNCLYFILYAIYGIASFIAGLSMGILTITLVGEVHAVVKALQSRDRVISRDGSVPSRTNSAMKPTSVAVSPMPLPMEQVRILMAI